LSRHEQGDSNVTGGELADAVQSNATAAAVNVSRMIASAHIVLSLPCEGQKRHNSSHEVLENSSVNFGGTICVTRTRRGLQNY